MVCKFSFISPLKVSPRARLTFILLIFSAMLIVSGCGSTTPKLSGNTSVVILATSTANDQLSEVYGVMNTLTLTSESGNTVSLLADPLGVEFIHVNGAAQPLSTVSVPQDVYTSATVTLGGGSFYCLALDPNGDIDGNWYSYGSVPASDLTVSLSSPITVTGTGMGLVLNLLVSKSATWTTCTPNGIEPFTITPNFSLTAQVLPVPTANEAYGKLNGLAGLISSVDAGGNGVIVDAAVYGVGQRWQASFNAETVFEGVSGSRELVAGLPVNMDVAIQADGTLVATRVAVADTDTTNLTVWDGPVLQVNGSDSTMFMFGRQQIGPILVGGAALVQFGSSSFAISRQLNNLAALPFPASFTASNMVAGQSIEATLHNAQFPGGPSFLLPAATVTLLPQTVDGTIQSVSTSGAFTIYTVTLAPYDNFPEFAVQPAVQTTLLKNPNTVVVYVDASTERLNTTTLAAGSVARFNGLVFNDNGTLRMDCVQMNDGVAP